MPSHYKPTESAPGETHPGTGERPPTDAPPGGCQFGLRYLFFLTLVMAVAIWLMKQLLPKLAYSGLFQVLIGVYLLAMAVYIGVRIPVLVRRHTRIRGELRARREALARSIEARQAARRAPREPPDSPAAG